MTVRRSWSQLDADAFIAGLLSSRRLVATRRRSTGATLRHRDQGATGPARSSADCHLPPPVRPVVRPRVSGGEMRDPSIRARCTSDGSWRRHCSSSRQSCVDRTASSLHHSPPSEVWKISGATKVDSESRDPHQLWRSVDALLHRGRYQCISAVAFKVVFQQTQPIGCSPCWTLPHDWSTPGGGTTMWCRSSRSCIGWRWDSSLSTSWQFSSTALSMAWRQGWKKSWFF